MSETNLTQWFMESEMGPLYLIASEKGLVAVQFQKNPRVPLIDSLLGSSKPIQILSAAVRQLEEYFSGQRSSFDLPFDIDGTEFQKNVWRELSLIPYGKTVSYKDIALKLKNAKAVRAVGAANGKNPLGVVVPCHRVINSDGKLGGYAGGLALKEKLLRLEKAL